VKHVIEHPRQTAAAAGIPDDRVRYEAESGDPGMTIVARAFALRADTIVLGNHRRGGPALPFLGSTVEQIGRAASCSVLTIRSPHERLLYGQHP
jgi:nucleotide-binding universal stress UspA family protein